MRQFLYLFAHPNFSQSVTNKALLEEVLQHSQFLVRDLYEIYADFHIDVKREQELMKDYDGIILHFPMRWYSMPSLLKEWIDVVLTPGFAFGPKGNKLEDKLLVPVITAGGSQASYQYEGANHCPLPMYLLALEQTARFCKMHYVRPIIFYGVHRYNEEQIWKAREDFREELTKLVSSKEIEAFSSLKHLER
jgi:glutathione-regulated potassium-efflux system ancillary protein KefG